MHDEPSRRAPLRAEEMDLAITLAAMTPGARAAWAEHAARVLERIAQGPRAEEAPPGRASRATPIAAGRGSP